MNDIITVKDLQLWYGQTKALKGVSMNIPEKSIANTIHNVIHCRILFLSMIHFPV